MGQILTLTIQNWSWLLLLPVTIGDGIAPRLQPWCIHLNGGL